MKLCKIPSNLFVVQVVEVLATDDDDRSRGNGPSFVFRNNIVVNMSCPVTLLCPGNILTSSKCQFP